MSHEKQHPFWDFGYHHHHNFGPRAPRGPFGRQQSWFGGPGGGWGDWFGDPPPRAERGGVRYLVLDALSERGRHGYEVIQAIEERSGQTYRPSPGVAYPTLQMLEELGHVRSVDAEGRKVYEITDAGRQELESNRAFVDEFYERSADQSWERYAEDFGDVMRRVGGLMKTFRHAKRRGRLSPSVLSRVLKVLDRAAAEIAEIIGEDTDKQGPRR
ncbi:MAG TPA: PadR family transcriptional regulator [Polyangiaceae bacterium]